ncbi:hypothetical protein, partial [Mycobacterium sp.]|uniref:hypothetical protein n=1 Tax=Mycobacterium sp. TaxID=1785 RepID=UPI003C756E09
GGPNDFSWIFAPGVPVKGEVWDPPSMTWFRPLTKEAATSARAAASVMAVAHPAAVGAAAVMGAKPVALLSVQVSGAV